MPGPSYTILTLEALTALNPDWEVRPLIGADLRAQLVQWHRGPELIARFPPVVVGRAGSPGEPGMPTFPDVSSTQIRRLLAETSPVDSLVPASVLREITEEDRTFWRVSPPNHSGPRATTP